MIKVAIKIIDFMIIKLRMTESPLRNHDRGVLGLRLQSAVFFLTHDCA
jgi:hypothetical protein